MRKSKFSADEIVEILNQGESGTPIEIICNTYHISHGTYYKWRYKYKGLEAPELQRLNYLEHKNRILKRLYGQSIHQMDILQKAIEGKL